MMVLALLGVVVAVLRSDDAHDDEKRGCVFRRREHSTS